MTGIVLLGMMGSGKTTVGRWAAEHAGVPFDDTDQMLVRKLGRPIHQLFQLYGEASFRGHETSLLASLEPTASVLATGGGIVTQEANWPHLARLGTTVYLDVPIETLIERLATAQKRRPLLEVDGWEDRLRSLMEARLPLYQRSHLTLSVDESPVEVIGQKLLDLVGWRHQQ